MLSHGPMTRRKRSCKKVLTNEPYGGFDDARVNLTLQRCRSAVDGGRRDRADHLAAAQA